MGGHSWKKISEGRFGTLIYVLLGLALALAIHKALGLILNTPLPVVTVSSRSMKPTLLIGDLVVVWGSEDYSPGDIIVFKGWEPTPIIHRIVGKYDGKWFKDERFSTEEFSKIEKKWNDWILRKYERKSEPVYITEGDNKHKNPRVDQLAYGRQIKPRLESEIYGEAVFKIPLLGWVKLLAIWLFSFLISNPFLFIGLLMLLAIIYILKEL